MSDSDTHDYDETTTTDVTQEVTEDGHGPGNLKDLPSSDFVAFAASDAVVEGQQTEEVDNG